MTNTELLKLVPTMQSVNLISRNFRKKKKKNLAKQGMENIIGSSLIKANADFIGEI